MPTVPKNACKADYKVLIDSFIPQTTTTLPVRLWIYDAHDNDLLPRPHSTSDSSAERNRLEYKINNKTRREINRTAGYSTK